jgi:NAD-dependent SIR2 family protein deacetylase
MSFRKNVFILGAGFSTDAGAKTMDKFFPHARDLKDDPASLLTPEDKQIFGRVIAYRFGLNKALAKIQEDLDNIETLFSFLEMDLQLIPETNQGLREDMKYLIGRTLEVDTFTPPHPLNLPSGPFRVKGSAYVENQYRLFVDIVSGILTDQKLQDGKAVDSIITFNYDLVLERELETRKILPIYNCGPNATYSQAFREEQIELNLLKLHGSINWGICRDCNRLHHLFYNQYLVKNLPENICTQCRKAIPTFLIVPPTWNKGTEEEFIHNVWKAALKELMEAGRIFIIGYSFPETDQFFKYMLGLALAYNNDLSEIYIVNPDESVWTRFEKLFNPYFCRRTVQYKKATTGQLIPHVPDLTRQRV